MRDLHLFDFHGVHAAVARSYESLDVDEPTG